MNGFQTRLISPFGFRATALLLWERKGNSVASVSIPSSASCFFNVFSLANDTPVSSVFEAVYTPPSAHFWDNYVPMRMQMISRYQYLEDHNVILKLGSVRIKEIELKRPPLDHYLLRDSEDQWGHLHDDPDIGLLVNAGGDMCI